MKNYRLLLIFSMFLMMQTLNAQITLNLALNPRPQPYLADWMNPVNGQMIISFIPGTVLNDPNIKIKTTLMDQSRNIVGISNINAENSFAKVFVSSNSLINVSLAQPLTEATSADICDLSGRLIFKANIDKQSIQVNANQFIAGTYLVKVYNSTQSMITKIVVQ